MSSSNISKKNVVAGKLSSTSANSYKLNGNKFFYSKSYEKAIKCYDKAIEMNSGEACYFTNRALSNIHLKRWSHVVNDCRRALEVDPYLLKAYVFLGHAFLELKYYDEAIASLTKADQLISTQTRYSNEEIQNLLLMARKGRQAWVEEQNLKSLNELKNFLLELLEKKKQERMLSVDESSYFANSYENSGMDCSEYEKDLKSYELNLKQDVINKYESLKLELENLFQKAFCKVKNKDVLDALFGKISFELMKDPVITPAGITYDRNDIEQHLMRVGHFDPISRSTLTFDKLIPNMALKEFIDTYLKENPWAEFC